jgi:hypothetical protein
MLLFLFLFLGSQNVAVTFEHAAKLAAAGLDTLLDYVGGGLDVVVTIHPMGMVFL